MVHWKLTEPRYDQLLNDRLPLRDGPGDGVIKRGGKCLRVTKENIERNRVSAIPFVNLNRVSCLFPVILFPILGIVKEKVDNNVVTELLKKYDIV